MWDMKHGWANLVHGVLNLLLLTLCKLFKFWSEHFPKDVLIQNFLKNGIVVHNTKCFSCMWLLLRNVVLKNLSVKCYCANTLHTDVCLFFWGGESSRAKEYKRNWEVRWRKKEFCINHWLLNLEISQNLVTQTPRLALLPLPHRSKGFQALSFVFWILIKHRLGMLSYFGAVVFLRLKIVLN